MRSGQPGPTDHALPLGDLLALGSQIRADLTPESLLQEVAETLQRVAVSPQVYVRLRNTESDELETVATAGVPAAQAERLRAESVSPGAFQPLLLPERRVSQSFLLPIGTPLPSPADTAAAPEAAPTLLVPLRGRGERLLGVIYIALPANLAMLDPTAAQVIEAIARQAALAVENVRLAERSARLLAKEQLLAELGRDVSATLDLQAILHRTVDRLAAAFGSGSLALLEQSHALVMVATAANEAHLQGRRYAADSGVLGWVMQHGRPYFTNDAAPDDLAPIDPAQRSFLIAPLRSGGAVIGTLNVGSPRTGAFAYEDVDLLEAIAAQVGGPITSARLYAESQRLAAQVHRRAEQLAVLNTIARAATATLDQTYSLPEVTAQIRNGFGYHHVDLFLVDEETNELVLAAAAGDYPQVALGYRQHINLGLVGRAARSGHVLLVDDVRTDPDYLSITERGATRAELVVPIVASGRPLGLINLESPEVGGFTDEDVAILETVADVLAGALENARLYQRAQAAAVFEERNRLARELHDSVTQQLFSMTLTAQAARAQLHKNPQRAATQLERLQETATAALAEMRALIFQLRPPALRDQGLVAALQQHAQAMARREGIAITLNVVGDDRLARGIEQPLYRIVQEALNNVFKHANAHNVAIMLEFGSERVRLQIVDDGQGFNVAATPSGDGRHLGVLSMRERAAEIGGTMEIHSSPGGTRVTVLVPRPAASLSA
jgi:signal transduction histidine kinase